MNMWKALTQLVLKWACMHNWKLHQEIREERRANGELLKSWYMHTFICTKCGKFVRRKV